MIKYSAFYPDITAPGKEGTALPTTRNVNRGEWINIPNDTQLNTGDTLQHYGSTFIVVAPHIKGAGTAAPDINTNYQIFAEKGDDGSTRFTWIAYANSADGTTDFTVGFPDQRTYIGIAANKTSDTESTNPADYVWSKMQGPQGPSIVVTPSQAGFTYLDGNLSPASQAVTFTATYFGLSGPATWSTIPAVKADSTGNTFTVDASEMVFGGQPVSQIIVRATVGTVSQSQLLQKIADPLSDQTSANQAASIPFQSTLATNPDFAGVTGPTRPADYAGTTVTFNPLSAAVAVRGNTLTNVSAGWDSGAYSFEFYIGAASLSARPIAGQSGEAMLGLSDVTLNATANNYSLLNYAFYIVNGVLHIYESGQHRVNLGAYADFTQLQITYDGVNVNYYINGNTTAVRTVGTVNGRSFRAAFTSNGGSPIGFRDITFGAWSMNNWSSVGGPNRPTDNADVTGSNTALNTTNVGTQTATQLVADAATAKGDASIAKSFANDVADNGVFSTDEKKRYIVQVNEWVVSVPALSAKLRAFGLGAQADSLDYAWSGGSGDTGGFLPYLQLNRYSNTSVRDTITRSLFQSKAQIFANALIAASNALDQRASETANAAGGIYDGSTSSMLVRSQLITSLGEAASIQFQGDMATQDRVLASYMDRGEITNIVPDSLFTDREFWNFPNGNLGFINGLNPTDWEQERSLFFTSNAAGDYDFSSDFFDLEVGAYYRVRTRIWGNDNNGQAVTGAFWPLIHMPNVAWWSLRHGGPVNPDVADAANAHIGRQDTGNMTHYFRCTSNAMRRIQFRFKSTLRNTNVVVQLSINKMSLLGSDVARPGSTNPYSVAELETSQGQAATIINQGNLATMQRAQLAFGENGVVDSDFKGGLLAYTKFPFSTRDGLGALVDMNTTDYFGLRNVAYGTIQGTFPNGSTFDWLATKSTWNDGNLTDLKRYAVPVKNGDRVYMRCLMARHRCISQMYMMLYDKNGVLLSAPVEQNGRSYGGYNGDPANFDLVSGITTITGQPNVAYMGLMWRMIGTGETDPYVFMTEPAMGVLGFDQTALPPYRSGPSSPNPDFSYGQGRIRNPQLYNTQSIIGAQSTTNLVPTQSNNGGSYTINLPAHSRLITGQNGPVTLYYGAASFNVPYSTYWVAYIDDPNQTGFGAPTVNYTTDSSQLLYPGRYHVSSGVTPNSGGTGGSSPGTGGGSDDPPDDNCVHAESFMPDNRLAYEYETDDAIVVLNDDFDGSEIEVVTSNKVTDSPCVEIVSESGIELIASVSTPITLAGGKLKNITEALGEFLPVEDRDGFRWEQIVEVNFVGIQQVAHISCNQKTYAAGKRKGRFIYTHNPLNYNKL